MRCIMVKSKIHPTARPVEEICTLHSSGEKVLERWESLSACAKGLGLTQNAVRMRIRNGTSYIISIGMISYRFEDDKE